MKILKILSLLIIASLFFACEGEQDSGSEVKKGGSEKDIRRENLEIQEELKTKSVPCDTLSLQEYILNTYPDGTYLLHFDQVDTYSETKPAVYYFREGGTFIFGLIAKSKSGERNIEVDNVVGFNASFKNLDSTKLGTAFFYLTLFECDGGGNFDTIWEQEVPIHSGFSTMKMKKWGPHKTNYMELMFIDGINSGYRKYNFFFLDGIRKKPHLLETYETLSRKRMMADVNNDRYPDYFEWRFVENDSTFYLRQLDSIPFYWDTTKALYVTKYTKRYKRKY